MCATVQKREATEHVFSHLKNTLWVFPLAALLLWSLNLWGFARSGSRNQSAVVFMTFNYVSDNPRNHVPMENFYFVACWCLPTGASFFFFLHSLCKHAEVRFCVLWHNSIYSPTVTWHSTYYSLPFCHIDQTGSDFQINLSCHLTCGNHVLPASNGWTCPNGVDILNICHHMLYFNTFWEVHHLWGLIKNDTDDIQRWLATEKSDSAWNLSSLESALYWANKHPSSLPRTSNHVSLIYWVLLRVNGAAGSFRGMFRS